MFAWFFSIKLHPLFIAYPFAKFSNSRFRKGSSSNSLVFIDIGANCDLRMGNRCTVVRGNTMARSVRLDRGD